MPFYHRETINTSQNIRRLVIKIRSKRGIDKTLAEIGLGFD